MYSIQFTNQYLHDLKISKKRDLDEEKLNEVIRILITGENLHAKYKDHTLKGIYNGLHECHISPDWLLVYSKDKNLKIITLIRTGTHSDLFK